jgi:hypothetical protein
MTQFCNRFSVLPQQAVPGNPSPAATASAGVVSDATSCAQPAPAIDNCTLSAPLTAVVEHYRQLSYDPVSNYFEKVERMILAKTIDFDGLKIMSNDLCPLLIKHLLESLKLIENIELQSLCIDPIKISSLFDAIRGVLERIGSIYLDTSNANIISLLSWLGTMISSRVLLISLRLDRFTSSTPIPSRSDIHDGLTAAVSFINSDFLF